MNIMGNLHKTMIEYKLCKTIMKNKTNIINELNVILKEKNGYKYNKKQKKIKKHFPASICANVDRNYDEYNNYIVKLQGKNNKVSYSLSSKPIEYQINNILSTATRRYNIINIFKNYNDLFNILYKKNICNLHTLSPIDFRQYLTKYNNKIDMKNRFSYFFDNNNRQFYDVIYTIKTENPHFYIDAHKKTLCDTMLICCNGKIFNIFFELDIYDPYKKLTYIYYEPLIKEMYNDKNI